MLSDWPAKPYDVTRYDRVSDENVCVSLLCDTCISVRRHRIMFGLGILRHTLESFFRQFGVEFQSHSLQHILNLEQRLLTKVEKLEHLCFRPLNQIGYCLDTRRLKTVGRTYRQFKFVYTPLECLDEIFFLFNFTLGNGLRLLFHSSKNIHMLYENSTCRPDSFFRFDTPVGPHFKNQSVIVGLLTNSRVFHTEVDFPDR